MLGYDHDSFWDQTAHTLSLTFEAYNIGKMNEHNERAWLAWHVAALQRTKKIPSLQKLTMKPRIRQSKLEEQLQGLKNWVQASGGKVIYKQ